MDPCWRTSSLRDQRETRLAGERVWIHKRKGREDRNVEALQSLAKTKKRRQRDGRRARQEGRVDKTACKQKFPRRERGDDLRGVCPSVFRLNGDCCWSTLSPFLREKRQAIFVQRNARHRVYFSHPLLPRLRSASCSNSRWNSVEVRCCSRWISEIEKVDELHSWMVELSRETLYRWNERS